MSDDRFVFQEESDNIPPESPFNTDSYKPGKILTVDDDINYQKSLLYSLRDLVIKGKPVEILTANSAAEAARVLTQHDDIAIILLDVVMEQDDAGLRLVDTIRYVQGNALIRIILLTGQPGVAPRKEVMHKYDINEYWNKSEIDHDTLKSVIAANLRSWHSMYELEQARIGLQMVVDASRHLASKYDKKSFIQVVLKEIGYLIGGKNELTLCVAQVDSDNSYEKASFIAGVGISGVRPGEHLPDSLCDEFGQLCEHALREENHQFNHNRSVLYFCGNNEHSYCYMVLVKARQNLSDYHIHLLQVFSENISSGFMQLSLVNQLSKLAYQDTELRINNRNWLLRELNTMNTSDLNESELIILEIDQYDSRVLSFDEHSLCEAIKAIYLNINNTLKHSLAIARISVDGFAVLYNKQKAPTDSTLISLINQTYEINGYTIRYSFTIARIELALIQDLPALQQLHLARSLLCYARQQGNGVISYQPGYRDHLVRDYQYLSDLMTAIENQEFYLAFQPQVDIHNNHPVGLEALIRWKKNGKVILPGEFIPLAERTGLISKIDPIVVRLVADAIHHLKREGYQLPISFNATVKDISNPEYIQLVMDLIETENISSELFDIEITETQAMESYQDIHPVLEKLHDAGIHISIDDFGTGYSSLSHISQLAADTIKIDIAFVTHLDKDKASQKVVEMVINLASIFGFSVIAEGIETELQKQELIDRGCHIGQGFLYARPMPIDELLVWLGNNRTA
ncbi:EAL domain-containing protein [Vibrio salinus]|uniref:EAL domain-containing protein n=1 Tax=Vibrio salinus TaxID=2899784 RepID=UPI001E60E690|nr:EAL domain-containing protein [Vibrio salinus]MCE0495075.1 EAL domain-containing protein [Vibrio salinus]